MSTCRECRRAVELLRRGAGPLGPDAKMHLDQCPECQEFAEVITAAVLSVEAACPDGFELAQYTEGTLPAFLVMEVAAHLTVCSVCATAVADMVALRQASVQPARVVFWSQAAEELRHRVGSAIRNLVGEGLWLPTPALATLRGSSCYEAQLGATQEGQSQVEVLAEDGIPVECVSASVLTPPFIDQEGTLFAAFLLKDKDESNPGELFLCIDMRETGLLVVGPGEVDGPFYLTEEIRFRVKFEEFGFSHFNTLIPISDCCIIVK